MWAANLSAALTSLAQDIAISDAKTNSKKEREHAYEKHMELVLIFKSRGRYVPGLSFLLVDMSIYETYQHTRLRDHPKFKPFSAKNYELFFRLLLEAEYAHSEIDMRRYDRENIQVNRVRVKRSGSIFNVLTLPQMSKTELSPIPNVYYIFLASKTTGQHYIGQVRAVDGDSIYFTVILSLDLSFDPIGGLNVGTYSIGFSSRGLMWDRMTCAVQEFSRKSMYGLIFNETITDERQSPAVIDILSTSTDWLQERLNKMNERQVSAIRHMLEAKCRPAPYILFGPPGTGKTTTIVELVVQIYHRNSAARILLTAGSNCCVDKLAHDIYSTGLFEGKMCRFATSNAKGSPDTKKYFVRETRALFMYRVIVTTNSMTGISGMRSETFAYVIVDEAGHACEPEVLMPINRSSSGGCIVLAGDPKQLGPVIKSREAERIGLGKSLLNRLTDDLSRYKFGANGFNELYLTRLNESYRCDPRILELSSELFYGGELKCHGRTPSSLLTMLKVADPRLFVSVGDGFMQQDGDSFSRYNRAEVRSCVAMILRLYNMGLEPAQIGLITPYKLHKEKLIEELKSRLQYEAIKLDDRFNIEHDDPESRAKKWMCKIDTVDGFQGGEREIILISLVRTPNFDGFVSEYELRFIEDAKRFNVSLSRAKWINIVFGHETVMKTSHIWSRYLDRCELLKV